MTSLHARIDVQNVHLSDSAYEAVIDAELAAIRAYLIAGRSAILAHPDADRDELAALVATAA